MSNQWGFSLLVHISWKGKACIQDKWGRVCAVELFGSLVILETRTLWYWGHHGYLFDNRYF